MTWRHCVLGVSLFLTSACCDSRFRVEWVSGEVTLIHHRTRVSLSVGAFLNTGDSIEAVSGNAVVANGHERYEVYPHSFMTLIAPRPFDWLAHFKAEAPTPKRRWLPVIAVRG